MKIISQQQYIEVMQKIEPLLNKGDLTTEEEFELEELSEAAHEYENKLTDQIL